MAKKVEKTQRVVHRSSAQIRGYRAQLVSAIRCSEDGAYAQLDLSTARALVEICDQAIHTEEGHEPPRNACIPT